MPSPGLSLVGFMPQAEAIQHLSIACIPPSAAAADLVAAWNAAQVQLGAPVPNAGNPNIQPIPAAHAAHIAQVEALPWVKTAMTVGPLVGTTFKLVEIAPLLAFQHAVDSGRSQHHCNGLTAPPTLPELVAMCLPTTLPSDDVHTSMLAHPTAMSGTLAIKSRNLSFQMHQVETNVNDQSRYPGFVVAYVEWSLPLVQVTRFNGRCYLHNGYHRVVGAALRGASHIPCAFRDVATAELAGVLGQGRTFDLTTMASPNPPTIEHYRRGSAHAVSLRARMRMIHVTWADHVVFDD